MNKSSGRLGRTRAAKPGGAVRTIRTRNGWTLAEASRRTGLPVSTLSKIENDKVALSYDKIARISEGFGIDIATLFAAEAPTPAIAIAPITGRRSITRRGQGKFIETPNYRHLYPAEDILNKKFVPIVAEIKARTMEEFGDFIRHNGEEFAQVLEGTVVLHTDLYAPTVLETGDSIYFDSCIGHAYLAGSDQRCVLLSICSTNESIADAESSEGGDFDRSHRPRRG
ncbi:MAG: XRE family transcriptional regulator [Caulobacteraceae bacterium]|nr:XRE family transcriptional regulator [Caulobacteraceae bacterium]